MATVTMETAECRFPVAIHKVLNHFPHFGASYNYICYIVSVKVQFFCLPIGQNRITCRSTKRHVRQPVRNQTFIDRLIIKWVQYACVSTVKFQSSFNSFAVLKF